MFGNLTGFEPFVIISGVILALIVAASVVSDKIYSMIVDTDDVPNDYDWDWPFNVTNGL